MPITIQGHSALKPLQSRCTETLIAPHTAAACAVRIFAVFIFEYGVSIWNRRKFAPPAIRCLWDLASPFFTSPDSRLCTCVDACDLGMRLQLHHLINYPFSSLFLFPCLFPVGHHDHFHFFSLLLSLFSLPLSPILPSFSLLSLHISYPPPSFPIPTTFIPRPHPAHARRRARVWCHNPEFLSVEAL